MDETNFLDYERRRQKVLKMVKNKFDLTKDELIFIMLLKDCGDNEIMLNIIISDMKLFSSNYVRAIKRLQEKYFFLKKRHPKDERAVIIYNIDHCRINNIMSYIDNIFKQFNKH